MKRSCFHLLALAMASCSPSETSTPVNVPPKVASFIAQKEKHAQALASLRADEKVPSEVWKYFQLAREGRWRAARLVYEDLRKRYGHVEGSRPDPTLVSTTWWALLEAQLAIEAYTHGEPKYSTAVGEGVAQSIPRGSIFFGGTDFGRALPTAFANSQVDGDFLFTIAQNALADGRYLNYLRDAYGDKIRTPTLQDSQDCFNAYEVEARKRLEHDQNFPNEPRQIKPGEGVTVVNNRLQVSSLVAVMAINGLVTKSIFDKNPEREFYAEESYPIDWMYPHLAPHGFIMKIHREPLPSLTPEIVANDRAFWTQQQAAMIGDWLTPDTPVKEICDFAEKIFLKKDLSGFRGDPLFIRSDYAKTMYSKLRSGLGGLYYWRVTKSSSSEEQQRMIKEADFAFRQAFALCPDFSEAIFRYVNLLVQLQRIDDALLIARTAERLNPKDPQLLNLITELERIRGTLPK